MQRYLKTTIILCGLFIFSASLGAAATPQIYTWSTLAGVSFDGNSTGHADGVGSNARFFYPEGVAVDKTGNVYVADTRNATIRKATPSGPDWAVSTFAGWPGSLGSTDAAGTNAQFIAPSRLAIDSTGNLFVSDWNDQTIRKITPAGVVTTFAGRSYQAGNIDGVGTNALLNLPMGLAFDAVNNLYVADSGNGTIRKITPAGVVTTLAGRALQTGSADGTGTNAFFNNPRGLTVVNDTNLFVADTFNSTIRKMTLVGTDWVVTTFAGQAHQTGNSDGTGTNAFFDNPLDIVADTNGMLYVSDSYNDTVRKITLAGVVTTFTGTVRLTGSADGTGTNAVFNYPSGLAVDASGSLFLSDEYNNAVRKITSAAVVTTLAGLPSVGSTDSASGVARFAQPHAVALDGATNLYVVDTLNNTIRKVTSAGIVTTLAGRAGVKGNADGTGTNALFLGPGGVAVDKAANVYVADTYNHTIRKVTAAGEVTTIAGQYFGSDDGTNNSASFADPTGLAMDAGTNLYVADTFNHTIRKMTPVGTNWVVTTIAGRVGQSGSADGTGTNAFFNSPSAVAVDAATNLYVADSENHTIRKLTRSGADWVVTTLAGQPTIFGSADGSGTNATFHSPGGIAVDNATNVFVADTRNNTIRRLSHSGADWLVTTVGGSSYTWGGTDGTSYRALFETPYGVAADVAGNLYVADTLNNTVRLGTARSLPKLQITRATDQVVMTWPSWASEFVLESNDNLSPAWSWNWTTQSGAVLASTNYVLTNSTSGSATFYRLSLP